MSSDINDILEVSENNQDNVKKTYTNKYAGALGAFAAIELISSIILSIYILINYGTIEVTGRYWNPTTELNPIGIGLGIGVLLQGIVIYVILSALKVMAEDIADIKNLSSKDY